MSSKPAMNSEEVLELVLEAAKESKRSDGTLLADRVEVKQ